MNLEVCNVYVGMTERILDEINRTVDRDDD